MEREKIKNLFKDVKNGRIEIEEAVEILKSLPYKDIGFAKIDTHRSLRKGFPEVVFSEGKSAETVAQIVKELAKTHPEVSVLATRADEEIYKEIKKQGLEKVVYHREAKIVVVGKKRKPRNEKKILVICAGTSDIPVAEEAAVTAEVMGNRVERLYDVGAAGVHRLFSNIEKLASSNVLIVVAGMDGVLPSIVGGLVDKPVIAVPTSVGYGSNFQGLAPLLTMLNSCAPGVVVVNIDNGFGAGYFASIVNQMGQEKEEEK